MKLRSQKKKTGLILAIIVAAIVLIAGIVLAVVLIGNNDSDEVEDPYAITEILVSIKPKTSYYVGESFDPTGTVVQVITNDFANQYMVDYTELEFSGFDSSVATNGLIISVKYKGFTTFYTVEIKEKPVETPTITGIKLSDNFTSTYDLSWWNTYGPIFDDVNLILVYSDGSEKELPMSARYCYDINKDITSAGTTQFTIKYNDGGVILETTVTVTITN